MTEHPGYIVRNLSNFNCFISRNYFVWFKNCNVLSSFGHNCIINRIVWVPIWRQLNLNNIINLQNESYSNYLTAIWVSCQTWVRQTSGSSGWKLSQDDSSLLEQQDVDGEQKARGDRNPIPKGESVGKSNLFSLYLMKVILFNIFYATADLCMFHV